MGLVKEVVREIGNRSREFYEFVLPPVDIHLEEGGVRVIIDMPGFAKEDIELNLCGDVLTVRAQREPADPDTMVTNQRPGRIDKKIRLPMQGRPDEEKIESARYADGVLTVTIPVASDGTRISID
ncbi:MAG: Hsp20/alpha crystallin family protein [Nitrosopumilus sp. H13]|nr:MAG: Hsp20/alpha crystallin family protein [Nitrosopumilus sp. H13]